MLQPHHCEPLLMGGVANGTTTRMTGDNKRWTTQQQDNKTTTKQQDDKTTEQQNNRTTKWTEWQNDNDKMTKVQTLGQKRADSWKMKVPTNQKGKHKRDRQPSWGGRKRQKTEVMNMMTNKEESMQVEEEVTFIMEEDHEMLIDPSNKGQYLNLNYNNINNTDGNDEPLDYYNWLADSATTLHITNQREAFVAYKLLTGKTVAGVGNNNTNVKGQGAIELESDYNGHKYLLRLNNVLYIPNNWKNLISLGWWDKAGGQYTGGGEVLTLITKDGPRH